jgi:octaprenyl-diphosphate synthase
MDIEQVLKFYSEDLKEVEANLKENLKSHAPMIAQVGNHLLLSGGKRLRPLLVILSSRFCRYEGEEDIYLASIVEFIHTASLLHDDVIDSAEIRRGKPVANSIWGNEASILVGDYLYSKALKLAVGLKNQRIMDTLSEATTTMSEGQIIELLKINDPDITEEEYLKMVEAKTAVLISACCRVGAIISGVEKKVEEALANFGLNLGMAFQLADDILDYRADELKLGKTLGKDLDEGKITLPLIHLLKRGKTEEVAGVKEIIRTNGFKPKDLEFILVLMNKYDSLGDCLYRAKEYLRKAKGSMGIFEDTPLKDALFAVADYVINREN